jgi:hypothetical protein
MIILFIGFNVAKIPKIIGLGGWKFGRKETI